MRLLQDLVLGLVAVIVMSIGITLSYFVVEWTFGFNWEDFWLILKLDLFWGLCLGFILNLSRG